jgi:hypothetical protein
MRIVDYLSDSAEHWYNYDSAGTGANRFATILLYMSDVGKSTSYEAAYVAHRLSFLLNDTLALCHR